MPNDGLLPQTGATSIEVCDKVALGKLLVRRRELVDAAAREAVCTWPCIRPHGGDSPYEGEVDACRGGVSSGDNLRGQPPSWKGKRRSVLQRGWGWGGGRGGAGGRGSPRGESEVSRTSPARGGGGGGGAGVGDTGRSKGENGRDTRDAFAGGPIRRAVAVGSPHRSVPTDGDAQIQSTVPEYMRL